MAWFLPLLKAAPAVLSAAGLAIGAKGASQQRKADAKSQAANRAAAERAENINWQRYLMQRGINPGNAATGEIPSNAPAMNARLPLWMRGRLPRT